MAASSCCCSMELDAALKELVTPEARRTSRQHFRHMKDNFYLGPVLHHPLGYRHPYRLRRRRSRPYEVVLESRPPIELEVRCADANKSNPSSPAKTLQSPSALPRSLSYDDVTALSELETKVDDIDLMLRKISLMNVNSQ